MSWMIILCLHDKDQLPRLCGSRIKVCVVVVWDIHQLLCHANLVELGCDNIFHNKCKQIFPKTMLDQAEFYQGAE